jgi:hypothetical protein
VPGKILDTEIAFRGDVPDDIKLTGVRGRTTVYQDPLDMRSRETLNMLDNNELLRYLLKNSDIDILLRTLGNGFFPRSITITTTPTEIIRANRVPRGYILLNANQSVSGVVTTVTVFPAGNVFPVAVTPSAAINVSAFGGAVYMLNVTEATAGLTNVALQSQDPISGNWVTVQNDIFGFGVGPAAVGTYHANVGAQGTDSQARLLVTVTGDTMTGSISAQLKPALAATFAGSAIFLGNEDVNTTIGYPLLSGGKEVLYMKENTPLFAIAVASTTLNIFELQ